MCVRGVMDRRWNLFPCINLYYLFECNYNILGAQTTHHPLHQLHIRWCIFTLLDYNSIYNSIISVRPFKIDRICNRVLVLKTPTQLYQVREDRKEDKTPVIPNL